MNQQTLEEIQKRNAEEQAPVVTEQNTQTLNRPLTPKEEAMNRKAQELQAPATESIPAETQPAKTYLGDYANDKDLMGIAKKKNVPLQNVFLDYQQWGKDTGNHTDFLPMWVASQNTDITKTPEQIEKDKKKAERQEKWEKIGNFLSHLGNFVGAAGFGAPSQTLESAKELTARQQAMRDKTEALRTANNKSFFENYWKQRADERANANQDRLERRYDLAVRQQEWKELSDQNKFDYNMEKLKIEQDYKDNLISLREKELAIKKLDAYTRSRNASTSAARESRLAGGTETETNVSKQTPFGTEKTTTKKTTRPAGRSGNSSSGKGKSLGIGL